MGLPCSGTFCGSPVSLSGKHPCKGSPRGWEEGPSSTMTCCRTSGKSLKRPELDSVRAKSFPQGPLRDPTHIWPSFKPHLDRLLHFCEPQFCCTSAVHRVVHHALIPPHIELLRAPSRLETLTLPMLPPGQGLCTS